jgi:hypothetical protein
MAGAEDILKAATRVLLVDWPSRDVPDTLVRAGYQVYVKGGPETDNFSIQELAGGEVVPRKVGRPDRLDLVYAHRPVDELPGIVAMAKDLGASAIWRQSGLGAGGSKDAEGCWLPEDESRQGRAMVEAAGLRYIDDVYIAGAVRKLREMADD